MSNALRNIKRQSYREQYGSGFGGVWRRHMTELRIAAIKLWHNSRRK